MITKAEKNTGRKVKDLNPMELAFCEHYALVGSETYSNRTASAEKAGYAATSAHTSAWKLLRRDVIRQKIQEIHAEQMSRLYMTADKVLSDLEQTRLAAVKKGDLAVATRCSELQGKHLALFVDRQSLETPERLRELDAAEAEECRQIALIRLKMQISGQGVGEAVFRPCLPAVSEAAEGQDGEGLHPQTKKNDYDTTYSGA